MVQMDRTYGAIESHLWCNRIAPMVQFLSSQTPQNQTIDSSEFCAPPINLGDS